MFISGYLGLVSAIGTGTVTELTTAGYARQPIQFSIPKAGVCVNSVPYNFGRSVRPGVGRAIWDAPSGGNLLLLLPLTSPAPAARPNWDQQDVGGLRLVFTALTSYLDGTSFNAALASPSQICGTCNDSFDIISRGAVVNPQNGFYVDQINTAQMTAGAYLQAYGGVLSVTPASQNATFYIAAGGASQALVWPPSGVRSYDMTLTAPNCAVSIAPGQSGQSQTIQIALRQDATGNRAVTWPAGITWAAGSPPTLSTAANSLNQVTLSTTTGGASISGVQNA